MTLEHITHHLTCGRCQDALRSDPTSAPGPGQCALDLDGERHWCPHPRTADSEWCEVHRDAIYAAAAEADPDTPAALTEAIEQADRQLGPLTAAVRQIDEGLRQMRALGTPETKMFAFTVEQDRITGELGRLLAMKHEAEAKLVALGHPGTTDGS